MGDTYGHSLLKAYFQEYRNQNLETKDIQQSSCDDGLMWAWLLFGECLQSPAHKLGYLIGAISLVLWAVGYLMTCTQIQSLGWLWRLLAVTFLVNVVSFAGAVLSLQMMLVISYDMITSGLTVVAMFAAAVRASIRQCWRPHTYQAISKTAPNRTASARSQQSRTQVTSHKAYGMTLSVCISSLLTVVYVTVTTVIDLKEDKQNPPVDDSQVHALQYQVLLKIVGYLLGCLACHGRFWIELVIVSRVLKEMRTNSVWKKGGIMLVTSYVLYILGVLLQSGSFRVTIVTLPWLLGRALQCCFRMFSLTSSTRLMLCSFGKPGTASSDKAEEENYSEAVAPTLFASSESEDDGTNVLFDRSCCSDTITANAQLLSNERKRLSSSQESYTSTEEDGAVTTSGSGLSGTNQHRKLIWVDGYSSHRMPAQLDTRTASQLRLQRLSLASQIESLSRTSSETSGQRVRSWISQSTPEEESPTSLTLTLNLDTTHKSLFNICDDNFANRKLHFSSSFALVPRKNSF